MADKKDEVEKAVYTKSTAQLDLERRLENDNYPAGVLVTNRDDDALNPEKVVAPWATEDTDTSEYRGVSPEYMTHANETEKPLAADGGPEAEAQKRLEMGVAGVRKTVDPRGEIVTAVGVSDRETVNTATSGESYSAKLVDAAPDFQGRASDDMDYAGKQEPTATPVKTTPAKAASPAKATGTNK